MDRRVKERLVGATILVVLIVLIVPELLSGPKQTATGPAVPAGGPASPLRNVTVDLATSKATPAEPVPAAADAAPAPPAEPPPTVSMLKAQPPALESAASPPISAPSAAKSTASRHPWAVQLGTFASRANAEKLVSELRARDLPAYVLSSGHGRSARYRVRIGPLADRGAAERVLAKMRKQGRSGSVVAP